jgi:coenzyme F420-0:L-glutamate ligase/coenzyme F420-1:gamma-L-glutamate ligase
VNDCGDIMHLHINGIEGLPLIQKGDDLPGLIADLVHVQDGDIICVASSVYSKSKGYVRYLSDIVPSDEAIRIGRNTGDDPRFIQSILDASTEVLLEKPFILCEVPGGHIGVRAGVDQSNVQGDVVILLPPDPMAAAQDIQKGIKDHTGCVVGVIITDTCGRAFRRGQIGHAIGWAGIHAIRDFRGDCDLFGQKLQITEEAVVDEIAGIANFVMGESNNGVPAVVVRGTDLWTGHDDLFFRRDEDFVRKSITNTRE